MFISNMPSFNCDKLMVPTAFHVLLSKSTWADLSYKPNLYLHGCVDFRSSLLPWWSQWLSRSIGQWGRPWLAMKLPLEIEMNQNATQVTARFLLLWVKYRATQSRCNYIYYIDRVFLVLTHIKYQLEVAKKQHQQDAKGGWHLLSEWCPNGAWLCWATLSPKAHIKALDPRWMDVTNN